MKMTCETEGVFFDAMAYIVEVLRRVLREELHHV